MKIKEFSAKMAGLYRIQACLEDGTWIKLKKRFKANDPALYATLHKIRERGVVDMQYWEKGNVTW